MSDHGPDVVKAIHEREERLASQFSELESLRGMRKTLQEEGRGRLALRQVSIAAQLVRAIFRGVTRI